MKTLKLAKNQWEDYFNRMSKLLEGKRASIEIASLDIGDQTQADKIVLYGIGYDPKDDLVEVALEGLDHLINNPRDIEIVQGNNGIETIGITDEDGRQQIVRLTEPLMLPAAS